MLLISSGFQNFYQRLFMFFSYRNWFYGLCVILRCVTSGGVFWHLDIKQNAFSISQYFMISPNTSSFFKNAFDFLADFKYFSGGRMILVIWLILVCSTMGRGLECFFRICYHIFPRVTILVTTHVTICLWAFCTISNAVALLVHYQMCYCVPYRTFSVK